MSDYSIGGSDAAHPPDLGKLTEGLGYNLRNVSETSDIEIVTAHIDGIGNVWTDCNVMDFSYHANAVGTALFINLKQIPIFVHNGNTYLYVGPRNVEIGLGGNHTTIESDFSHLGTGDHNLLNNREMINQHPTAAITGLDTTLGTHTTDISALQTSTGTADTDIAQLKTDVTAVTDDFADHINVLTTPDPHPQYSDHQTLTGRLGLDCHPMSSITGLNAGQQTQDTNITNLAGEQGIQRTEIDTLTGQQGVNTIDISDLKAMDQTHDQWHVDHVDEIGNPDPHPQYAGGAGTTDHAALSNREIADQHPIAAITGLGAEQAAQDQALTDHVTQITTPDPHPQYMTSGTSSHVELANRGAIDAHPQLAITDLVTDQLAQDLALDSHKVSNNEHEIAGVTGLLADQLRQDTALSDHNLDATAHGLDLSQAAQDGLISTNADNFTDHINQTTTPNPHNQYLLVADYVPGAIEGYGGVSVQDLVLPSLQGVFDNAFGGWYAFPVTTIIFDTGVVTAPVNITQDIANNGLILGISGVWMLNISGTFSYPVQSSSPARAYLEPILVHDLSGDELFSVRFPFLGSSEDMQINASAMFEVPANRVGDLFKLEWRYFGSNTYTNNITIQYLQFSIYNLGPL